MDDVETLSAPIDVVSAERVQLRFGREIPTLVLTGDTSALPARLFNRPGVRLLNKPVDGPTLAAEVDAILRASG